jgi:hypothetical protein
MGAGGGHKAEIRIGGHGGGLLCDEWSGCEDERADGKREKSHGG